MNLLIWCSHDCHVLKVFGMGNGQKAITRFERTELRLLLWMIKYRDLYNLHKRVMIMVISFPFDKLSNNFQFATLVDKPRILMILISSTMSMSTNCCMRCRSSWCWTNRFWTNLVKSFPPKKLLLHLQIFIDSI